MAKRKKMKGVSSSVRKGVEYWYANINGKKTYCGVGDKGREIAIAAKAKEISKNPKLAAYEVQVTDSDGDTVAIFQGMVYRKREAIIT